MASRFSEADEPELVRDPALAAQIESENALRQYDAAMAMLDRKLQSQEHKIRPSEILFLHRTLMERLSASAGNYRPAGVAIRGSRHAPPPAEEVARLVEELCEYVNDNWKRKTALHLASFILWRINCIHPFADGNGRTARIISYLVLCLHSGTRLPGTLTIPEQISRNKSPYYAGLEDADAKSSETNFDVGALEDLLSKCLASQLLDFYQQVGGQSADARLDRETRQKLDRVLAQARGENEPVETPSRKGGIIGWIESHPALSGGLFVLLAAIIAGLFSLIG